MTVFYRAVLHPYDVNSSHKKCMPPKRHENDGGGNRALYALSGRGGRDLKVSIPRLEFFVCKNSPLSAQYYGVKLFSSTQHHPNSMN